MLKFKQLFKSNRCSVIGMVHLDALPGTPLYGNSIEKIVSKACKEAEIYVNSGVDGILLENMHDIPYVQSKHLGPEITATMSRVCNEVRRIIPAEMPCGVQILACGNKEALSVAHACSLNFIRAEGFVFSHIADEGFTDANAGQILRFRKQIGGENILVFTDIKKKHSSHTITGDVSLAETARAAEFFCSDGLIVTGTSTGAPTNTNDFKITRNATKLPVIIGSGVTIDNLHDYTDSDALIIGSHFKVDGKWRNEVDSDRVKLFMKKLKSCLIKNQKSLYVYKKIT